MNALPSILQKLLPRLRPLWANFNAPLPKAQGQKSCHLPALLIPEPVGWGESCPSIKGGGKFHHLPALLIPEPVGRGESCPSILWGLFCPDVGLLRQRGCLPCLSSGDPTFSLHILSAEELHVALADRDCKISITCLCTLHLLVYTIQL